MPDGLSPLAIAASLIGGYLLGSIPFGIIATRLGGGGDLRKVGSGNIGATNVLRTGRRDLALITLIGDGGKGAASVLIAAAVFHAAAAGSLAGAAAFVGHLFPVWLRFRGGKGVATFFGTMIAAAWPAGLAAGAIWILMAFVFRFSSLAGLAAAALAPALVWLLDQSDAGKLGHIWLAAFMAVLIFARHGDNIRRLLKGEEPRIGAGGHARASNDPQVDPDAPAAMVGHNRGPKLDDLDERARIASAVPSSRPGDARRDGDAQG